VGAYAAGLALEFLNGAGANTGAATIAVSGLTAQSILRPDGSALSAGDMPSGALLMIRHDGTAFRLANLLAGANAATESAAGIAEIATQAEANTGTDDVRFMTPLKAARRRAPSLAQASGYTVVAADNGRLIRATGTWVLALTAAATLGDGFTVRVRNGGTGIITVDPDGAETIDGVATLTLRPGAVAMIECDGIGWVTTLLREAASLPFTRLASSGYVAFSLGGTVTFAHNFGVVPKLVVPSIIIDTAHTGFSVGHIYEIASGVGGLDSLGNTTTGVRKTTTEVFWKCPLAALYVATSGGTGGVDSVNPALARINLDVFA
jgi:hypothetical protein